MKNKFHFTIFNVLVLTNCFLLTLAAVHADKAQEESTIVDNYGLLMINDIDKKAAFFQRSLENGSISSDENNPIETLVKQCLKKELDMLVEWVSLDAATKIMYRENVPKLMAREGNLKVLASIQMSKDVLVGSSEELGTNHDFAEMLRVFRKSLLQIKQYFS